MRPLGQNTRFFDECVFPECDCYFPFCGEPMRGVVQQASGITAQTMERLQYRQGAACTLRSKSGEPAREPRSVEKLGCSRGSSVQAACPITKMLPCGDAAARLLPRAFAELEKGAQENWPQHPDARSVQLPSPL